MLRLLKEDAFTFPVASHHTNELVPQSQYRELLVELLTRKYLIKIKFLYHVIMVVHYNYNLFVFNFVL